MTEEEKESLLLEFHEDVSLCKDYLASLRHEIVNQDISKYPIFVATQEISGIGRLVVSKKELDIRWSFYASHLEEFAAKKIIEMNKIDDFINLYKENTGSLCLFVIMDNDFSFIFLPYK